MLNFKDYAGDYDFGNYLLMIKCDEIIEESATATRYSVEVNFRSKPDEVLHAFAKIALGYVSAGLKQHNYHIKHVYTDKPPRIIVASRNWDDGEWTVVVTWSETHKCFVISKGFYNKDRNTISVQASEKCTGENAFEITKQVYNMMHDLKNKPDRFREKLKPVKLKPGPKG